MDANVRNLDHEYEQFLKIMLPHISQLKDRKLASICSAWIQRLNDSKEHEKILRNKYIVTLCYQLSKGVFDMPFLKGPTDKALLPINEPTVSEVSSSEVECLVLDSEYAGNVTPLNQTLKTLSVDPTHYKNDAMFSTKSTTTESNANLPFNQTGYHNQYPTSIKPDVEQLPETYRYRTHNIISKLQEIKKQNALLHHELKDLKEKSSGDDSAGEFNDKVNTSTLYMRLDDSNTTLDSLKIRLKEVQDVRNALIDKVQSMQEFIDNLNDLKNQEIEEIQARHKLELINTKSCIKQETKNIFENRLEEQKQQYELKIKELRDENLIKDNIIADKDKIIQQKESEILRLSEKNNGTMENLHSILKKLVDRPNEEQRNNVKVQNHLLQNRILKLEKAKIKCVKTYELKLASLQRERHLIECSFHIQLVRQRAQIVNDVAGDCQYETKKAVDKLEAKYQEIVANMQATAIQRRIEDQMAVASILQAASGIRNDSQSLFSPMFPKSASYLGRNKNQRSNSEVAAVLRGNKAFRKKKNGGFEDEARYGELGALFDKVHVPQRDTEDKARK